MNQLCQQSRDDIRAFVDRLMSANPEFVPELLVATLQACSSLVFEINSSGGVVTDSRGRLVPMVSEDSPGLATAAKMAAEALEAAGLSESLVDGLEGEIGAELGDEL